MTSIKNQCGGYTLIEIMVTIALVAILASAAFASYQAYVERARMDQALKDIAVIQLQIDAHAFNNNNTFPMSLNEINLGGARRPLGQYIPLP